MSDKEIKLNISKIFNWPKEKDPVQLEVEFYSAATNSLVARKSVETKLTSNYLELGVSLKIKYSERENHIIVVIHREVEGRQNELIGEAEINLDELQNRKIKYFTLGEMDKVLQIELVELKNQRDSDPSTPAESQRARNEKFLQDRKKFLESVNQKQAELKKSFSDKIHSLLNNDAVVREYSEDEGAYDRAIFGKDKGMRNSHYEAPGSRNDRMGKTGAQKHRLMLNTLNIVPGADVESQTD